MICRCEPRLLSGLDVQVSAGDFRLGDEADDLHFGLVPQGHLLRGTGRTFQMVNRPDLLDAFPPGFRGDPARLVL